MASFYFFDSLTSTMDEARARVLEGIEDGSVIIALQQSQGRGRRGRVWESIPGNLYFTYITYLGVPLSEAPQLSLVACVAVGEELRLNLPPTSVLTYKWPNDLLLNKKKVGGLLLEAIHIPNEKKIGYLIGGGINLKSYPQETRYPATSFENEGMYLCLEEVLHGVVASIQHYISLWRGRGFAPIQSLWMKEAANLEKKITVDLQGKTQEGIFKGIDEEGALMLVSSQGLVKVNAGEILR